MLETVCDRETVGSTQALMPQSRAGSRVGVASADRVVGIFSGYALFGGIITLVGWFAGIPRLTDWIDSGITMFPNTAICAAGMSVGLLLLLRDALWRRAMAGMIGLTVAVIGGATLFEHISRVD